MARHSFLARLFKGSSPFTPIKLFYNMKSFFNINKLLPLKYIYSDLKLYFSYTINFTDLLLHLFFLKQHQLFRFRILSTISCVDYPELYNRFELTYTLMSISFPFILNLKIKISEFTNIDSSSLFFKSGVWLEREIWDMFGLYFKNNFDLRRILTDYGFPYHPLRKTFPLQGFFQIHYNFIKKKIFYINNNFNQIKPNKNINSVWNKLI